MNQEQRDTGPRQLKQIVLHKVKQVVMRSAISARMAVGKPPRKRLFHAQGSDCSGPERWMLKWGTKVGDGLQPAIGDRGFYGKK